MTDTTPHADTTNEHASKSFACRLPAIGRILMGLMFFIFGLNGFLHFIPQPKEAMPEGAEIGRASCRERV